MSFVVGTISAVFWGLLVLSVLVFVHEGGHYLAARAFGVRVTEFFLGMPSPVKLSHKSSRHGTEVGVTPILLGGYTRICGMEGDEFPDLARVLACVQRHGRVAASAVAAEVGIDVDEAYRNLAMLVDWGSIRPFYDPDLDERPGQAEWPSQFQTIPRDADMLTEYDRGNHIDGPGASVEAAPRPLVGDPDSFLAQERSHTYLGCSFPQRVAMLVAGPLVNIALAFVIVVSSLMLVGVQVASGQNVLGGVAQGSLAEAAGLAAGDVVTSIDGVPVSSWDDISSALDSCLPAGRDFEITVERGGETLVLTVDVEDGVPQEMLGIYSTTETYHLSFAEASSTALNYAGQVVGFVVRLLIPTHTMEVLEQSSSIVGISVAASEAAAAGLSELLMLAAAVSMSPGFMNLLPIPPLDGGKILIEVIQLALGRPLSMRAQNVVSYVGLAFFLFVFVFVLRNDILRIFQG